MPAAGTIRSTSPLRSRSARNCIGYLHEYDALFRRSQEAERIGKEHGITLLGEIMAEITRGIAWLGAGHTEDGAQQLGEAIELLRQTGHRIWIWYLRALQAEGLAKIGDLDRPRR